ncbi:MAG: Gmad2 immunoglobulin-like domain-containing protein [Acidimicrobiales bacterium]
MSIRTTAAALTASLCLLAACGDDDEDDVGSEPTTSSIPVEETTTTTELSTTTAPAVDDQPALWPAPGEVIADPIEVARSFYVDFLGQPEPSLGEFQEGDPTSGEVPVFGRTEGGEPGPLRSTLLLRRRGAGWAVVRVASEAIVLEQAQVPTEALPGPITVSGRGRGFEGTLLVRAVVAGEAGGEPLDQQFVTAGALEELEPFAATVDVGAAASGSVVAILVFNESAIDGSIGDLAAIPVLIG